MNRQPLITAGVVTSLATAVIGVIVAAGVPMSDELQTAILALVGVAAPLVVAALAWRKVTPSADVVAVREPARNATGSHTVAGAASPLPDGTPVGVTAVGPPPT